MIGKTILESLPYQPPFLFVDELTKITDNGVTGNYTFKESEYFYRGHFKDYSVTPGVILTEVMAQKVSCLGIYLLRNFRHKKTSNSTLIQYSFFACKAKTKS